MLCKSRFLLQIEMLIANAYLTHWRFPIHPVLDSWCDQSNRQNNSNNPLGHFFIVDFWKPLDDTQEEKLQGGNYGNYEGYGEDEEGLAKVGEETKFIWKRPN